MQTSYCHNEEKWKPIEMFEKYYVGKKRVEKINSICNECLAKGKGYDAQYRYVNEGGQGNRYINGKLVDKC